ncbi:MAG: methyltransferase [Phaeodactylibacter sp.]|nr:methyltransferase [Phaeodactylibacter sp.]MCB9264381.1 methyltransferase [Lewinellaceae bacterium]MCB9286030.1 methyltransferase [Lewinellaceae bacterium]
MKFLNSLRYLLAIFTLSLLACQPSGGNDQTGNGPMGQQTESANTSAPVQKDTAKILEDYDNTNRVVWQKPEVVIDLLGNLEGKTIADIGAGTGFFALRLAPKAKKVIAIDIDPRFTSYLDSLKAFELPEDVQERLETRLALPDDPKLAPGEADIVMIVNTFMYIKDQVAYLENLKRGISDGGLLLIIDFKKKRTPLGPPSQIRVPLFEVEDKLIKAGYREVMTNDTALDYQYIVTARK